MPASKSCPSSLSVGTSQIHITLPMHLNTMSAASFLNISKSSIAPGFTFFNRDIFIPPPLMFLVVLQNSPSAPRGLYLTASSPSTLSNSLLSFWASIEPTSFNEPLPLCFASLHKAKQQGRIKSPLLPFAKQSGGDVLTD